MRKPKRIPIYKTIWCRIRYWQMLYDVSDEELSSMLGVVERTMKEYDKDSKNITLDKIEKFLVSSGVTMDQLL